MYRPFSILSLIKKLVGLDAIVPVPVKYTAGAPV